MVLLYDLEDLQVTKFRSILSLVINDCGNMFRSFVYLRVRSDDFSQIVATSTDQGYNLHIEYVTNSDVETCVSRTFSSK